MINNIMYRETYITRRNAAIRGNHAFVRPTPANTGIGRSRGSDTGTGGDSLS